MFAKDFSVGISSDAHTTYPIICSASTSGAKDICVEFIIYNLKFRKTK
ncbi:MAG: hypothetical protein WCG25_09585 [bacterium]